MGLEDALLLASGTWAEVSELGECVRGEGEKEGDGEVGEVGTDTD